MCCCAVVSAPGSVWGQAVRLNRVCFLRLAATCPRLDPGRYEARCRLKLLPDFWIDELNITASPMKGRGERESRTYTRQQLQQLPAASAAAASAAGWVEIGVGPVVLERPGAVEVAVHATSGLWKHGLLFDCFTFQQLPGTSQGPARRRQTASSPPAVQLGLGAWSPAGDTGALWHVPQW